MESKDYLLSVIIPTRNRQVYAIQAVKQILSVTDERTQIVVQDNSDNQSLMEMVKELGEQRIVYNYSNEVLATVDNFEAGALLATGEYVTFIGDDDGILPSITSVVLYARQKGYDCVTAKVLATYYWPHSGAKNYGCSEETGYLRLNKYSHKVASVNAVSRLKRVLHNGCQFYHALGVPKPYHGLIRRDVILQIQAKYGRLFKGLSPDIYSSFTICLAGVNTLYVNFPFTIDGNCPKSGAGAQAQGKHTGKLSDAPHFHGNPNYKWEPLVPQVFSIQTIWADSGMAAIRAAGRDDLVAEFSVERLVAYTMTNNRTIARETFQEYLRIRNVGTVCGIIRLIPAFVMGPIPNFMMRALRRIVGLGKVGKIVNDIPNITVAGERISAITGEWNIVQ